jgi:hypothetical protein
MNAVEIQASWDAIDSGTRLRGEAPDKACERLNS